MKPHVLLKNLFSAAGQTLVQTAVLFLVYRYVIATLGIERVGIWGVVLATTSVARVSELGLAGSVTKFVSTHRARGDEDASREAVQTAASTLGALLAFVLPLLYVALTYALPLLLPTEAIPEALAVLPYALASMWLMTVSGIWLGALDGCLRSDLRAALVIVSTLVFMALAFVAVPSLGLVGVAVAQVVQALVVTALGWMAVRYVMAPMPYMPTRWRRLRFGEMLGYGVNLQIMAVVMLLFEPTTKILFTRYGGLAAAGYFELAQQLVMKARALIVESNRVVVPVIAGMEGFGAEARRFYSRNVRYVFLLLTPFFGLLAALVPAVSELWIGRYEQQFVVMAVALICAWYINSMTAPTYFAYLGRGELRSLTVSHVAFGLGNAVLGMTLGPVYGWQGVTAAFVLSLVVGSLMPVWTFHRAHQVRIGEMLAAPDVMLAAFCAGTAAVALAGYTATLEGGGDRWIRMSIVAFTTAAFMAATCLHPLAPDVLRMMRRSRPRGRNQTR